LDIEMNRKKATMASANDPKWTVFETPAGWMAAAFTEHGLWELTFPVSSREEAETSLNSKGMERFAVETNEEVVRLAADLRRYFSGERVAFTTKCDLDGLALWHQKVLQQTAQIPYGETMTYGELASVVGSPGAARAIGQAMARNPIPIVIPCHRIVAASGKPGGFSAGWHWKQRLFELEGIRL
jgi:methylated-DNA-[protein]-cysteine S-methyltransferase